MTLESQCNFAKRPHGYPEITVIICTLNEAENLPHVLPKMPDWVDEVIIVDGNSTDDTVAVSMMLCPRARVICQPGKGKADALTFGIQQATGNLIVTMDADGDSTPEALDDFIKPLVNGYDFCKGSRLAGGRSERMSRFNYLGNKILALTCNLLYGTKFTDVCSGFNSFRKEDFYKLQLTINTEEAGCSMEQQMIVRAKKLKLKIKEIPYHSRGRITGSSVIGGFIRATKQGFIDWAIIIKERFNG